MGCDAQLTGMQTMMGDVPGENVPERNDGGMSGENVWVPMQELCSSYAF